MRLNFRLKGCVSRQYLWTVITGMTILQLFTEVFTQRNFVADFIQLKLNFFNKKYRVWATLSGLRGNVRTPATARWKARGRLPIHHKWFFVISYVWDVIGGNLSKLACFERDGSLWAQIWDGRSRHPWTTVGVRKLEWLPFRTISKYPQCVLWFCHKACVWRTDRGTDRQTDRERQNCDSLREPLNHTKRRTEYSTKYMHSAFSMFRSAGKAFNIFRNDARLNLTGRWYDIE